MAEENYFFVPEHLIGENHFSLPEDEAHHFNRVLRKSEGEMIWLLDGIGTAYRGCVTKVDPTEVSGNILESFAGYGETGRNIHLGIGILKKDKLEWVVEKITELGVNKISFVLMDHSIKKDVNLVRLNRIVRSAVKQCGRSFEPQLSEPMSLNSWIRSIDGKNSVNLICHPGGKKIVDRIGVETSNYNVLVGPEGGFSENELDISKRSGFLTVDLGNRRLRAETAAIAACAQIVAL